MRITYLLFIMGCTYCASVNGQSIETTNLKWGVDQVTNTQKNELIPSESWLQTQGQVIKWYQKGGLVVYEFFITGRDGSWTDISLTGEYRYAITFRGLTGSLVFRRTSSGLEADLNVNKDNSNLMPYRFHIINVSSL